MAAGYLFVRSNITDPVRYERMRAVIVKLAESYGARLLVRTPHVRVLHGSYDGLMLAVYEFPSMRDLEMYHDSPEYSQLEADLIAAGVVDLWIVPGV